MPSSRETLWTAVPFSRDALVTEFARACNRTGASTPDQVLYVAAYLSKLAPKSMLVERPYIDRHFLQEYLGYYATTVCPPPSHTTRIHFFARTLDDGTWDDLLLRACSDEAEVRAELQPDYLGYTVVRPLSSCPMGRTVLRTYTDVPSRCYAPSSTSHDVHLAGLTLTVTGMPFQQQDQGLGACATTALWSALARVTRADGGRAVTPLEVARAAHRNSGPQSLMISSGGMTLEEMTTAIREIGYLPHFLRPYDRDIFVLALKCYMRAGIPVVLRYRVDGDLHAVAVAGFRDSDESVAASDLFVRVGSAIEDGDQLAIPATGASRLYVHDDRLGPYARVVFADASPEERADAKEKGYAAPLYLRFELKDADFTSFEKPVRVESALIPVYPKLRLTADDLITYATEYVPLIRGLAGEERRDALRLDPFFSLGGKYLANVATVMGASTRTALTRRRARLSRYVGVLRFFLDNEWFMDIVIDGTDVKRPRGSNVPALLIACAAEADAELLRSSGHFGDGCLIV